MRWPSSWLAALTLGAMALTLSVVSRAQAPSPPAQAPEAQPRPLVLIAAPPPGTGDLTALLIAELSAFPIDVVKESGVGPAKADAAAVLRLTADPRTVTVWTASTMRLRTYAADPRRPAGSDEALARQVAEVVRAELLLVPVPAPPDPVPAPPPNAPSPAPLPLPTAAPPPEPRAPLFVAMPPAPAPRLAPAIGALGIAPALTTSPGPLPVLAQMQIDLRLYLWRGLRLKALTLLPLTSAVTEEARGDVVTVTGQAGASLGYDLLGGSPLRLAPSAGAAWQWISVTGRATPPFESSRDSAHAAMLFAGLDADYQVSSWLSLVAGARLGVVLPTLRFAIAGDEIGTFGRPAVQLFAGAAVPIRGLDW